MISFATGLEIAIPWSSSASGNGSTTPVLIPSNSTGLECRLLYSNSFVLTPKQWIEKTGAIGIVSNAGRYGGTYAHKDIAFEFASWVSVEFKLYLIKEFQRLKDDENRRLSLTWNLNRTLSKLNYRILPTRQTQHSIPAIVTASAGGDYLCQ